MNIGERIKARRKELGMSVDELCMRLGKNRATIYRYETGEIEKVPVDALVELAQVLRTTPHKLLDWEEVDKEKVPSDEQRELLNDKEFISLFDDFRKLSVQQKCVVKELIKCMHE